MLGPRARPIPTRGADPVSPQRKDKYGFRNAGEVKAAVEELVGMGLLVAVFDPECGENRYCTPDVRDSLVARGFASPMRNAGKAKSGRRRLPLGSNPTNGLGSGDPHGQTPFSKGD